ncbi:MAG: GlsB/YeaQ/YmgE family stress response membrane protein [Chloroflexota bacterium]
MGLITWVIFGALAGWVASLLTGTNSKQGCLTDIIIGVVGAFLGGFILNLVLGGGFSIGWDWRSFVVAVGGAVVLLFLTGATRRKNR